jgi:pimeloyl-ACP methyl ester carboxylesterase
MFKIKNCIMLICLSVGIFALRMSFASEVNLATYSAVKILSEEPCVYKEYSATCGEIQVPENHFNPVGKKINLPYQLVKGSVSEGVERPVVMPLGGGPGMTNMVAPSKEILDVADVLLVGFRGIDGSVDLSCPEIDVAFVKESRLFAPQSQNNIQAAFDQCLKRLQEEGIDTSVYNPQQSVEDMEAVRDALEIDKVSLLSGSYGTRLAQYYAMQHPQSLNRIVMVATNPPGRFVWVPELVDNIMNAYGIDNAPQVLASMPESWMGISLDPARIGINTFALLYSTDSAAMAINAFEDAGNGDYAGLAIMSLIHDMMVSGMMNWGHLLLMAGSVDFDKERNYRADLAATDDSFGSPMAMFLMTIISNDALTILPDDFRYLKPITTPTLVIGGSLDISTPAVLAEKELMPYLENGSVIRVGFAGHYDLWKKPVRELMALYLKDGTIPVDFDLPKPSFEAGFLTLSRIAKLTPVAGVLVLVLLWFAIRFIIRKVKGRNL